MSSFAEVKVLQQQNMLNMHHMHTWVCTVYKWNYEQHLYTHTLIPIINRYASTNEPLSLNDSKRKGTQHSHMTNTPKRHSCVKYKHFYSFIYAVPLYWYIAGFPGIVRVSKSTISRPSVAFWDITNIGNMQAIQTQNKSKLQKLTQQTQSNNAFYLIVSFLFPENLVCVFSSNTKCTC